MMIRLEVPEGPEVVFSPHTYAQDHLTIGADTSNDVSVPRDDVTPFHAVIEMDGTQGTLRAGKDGGLIKVNGTEVKEPTLLQPGDVLHIGSVELHYKLVPFPHPETTRRISWLEWATLGLVVAGVLGQILFLAIPSCSLRREIQPERLVPTPTPVPLPTPDPALRPLKPTPTPKPLISEPGQNQKAIGATRDPALLTERAGNLIEKGDLESAEQRLRRAIRLDRSYLPAYLELARLLSEQKRFEESLVIWERIQRRAPAGSDAAMDARFEIPSLKRRIERQEEEQTLPEFREIESYRVPTPVPDGPDPFDLLDQQTQQQGSSGAPTVILQAEPLTIEGIGLQRYADSPRYDEFRILSFTLRHVEGTPAVRPGSVKVRVNFFEQMGAQVRTADIPVPRVVLAIPEGLSRGQGIEDLSAAYEVPPGKGADGRNYYGAVIEVFIDGKEIHRAADPSFLLDIIR